MASPTVTAALAVRWAWLPTWLHNAGSPCTESQEQGFHLALEQRGQGLEEAAARGGLRDHRCWHRAGLSQGEPWHGGDEWSIAHGQHRAPRVPGTERFCLFWQQTRLPAEPPRVTGPE